MMPRLVAALPAVLLATLVATPAHANHCEGGCDGPAPTIGKTSDRVPLDGVLAFPISDSFAAEVAFKHFQVAVHDAGGSPVDGTLELPAGFSTAIWRPTAPWAAGARHTVTTALDVGALVQELFGESPDGCQVTERVQEVEVDAQPLPPAEAPPLIVEATHMFSEHRDLDTLVCCDEAFPRLDRQIGHCYEPDLLKIPDGTCASLQATGYLNVRYTLDTTALPAAVTANLAVRLDGRGSTESPLSARTTLFAPECLRFEVLDLARGQVFVDERCHGETLADQLGHELERDPTAELAAACAGEPYVCEVEFHSQWDETRCRPWPEQIVDDGCGCTTDRRPVTLVLLLLPGLRRPRRRATITPPRRAAPGCRSAPPASSDPSYDTRPSGSA